MRIHSLLVGCLIGGACVASTRSAHADSFFVSFTSGGTPIGARVQGAVFDAPTKPNPGGGPPILEPLTIEIDDWSLFQPTLDAENAKLDVTAKVEFTAPNAQGKEEVYMIATYQGGGLSRVAASYDASGSPKVTESIGVTYTSVKYGAPPPTLESKSPVRKMPSSAPSIRRAARAAAIAERVDDAYLEAPSLPGESTDHPGKTRILTFALKSSRPKSSAGLSPLQLEALTISKAPGKATAALQAAASKGKLIDPMTFTFVQHHGTAPDTIAKTVVLKNAFIQSDSIQVGAGSVETISIMPMTLKLTVGSATTEVTGTMPNH